VTAPRKRTVPDRVIDPSGHVRCRVLELIPSDEPKVLTALLTCGHLVRYDVTIRAGKSKICEQCTVIRQRAIKNRS
jgi:hypothetical protein